MNPVVTPYSSDHIEAVVQFMSEAFVTNPINMAIFGKGQLDQHRLFFQISLEYLLQPPTSLPN